MSTQVEVFPHKVFTRAKEPLKEGEVSYGQKMALLEKQLAGYKRAVAKEYLQLLESKKCKQ